MPKQWKHRESGSRAVLSPASLGTQTQVFSKKNGVYCSYASHPSGVVWPLCETQWNTGAEANHFTTHTNTLHAHAAQQAGVC